MNSNTQVYQLHVSRSWVKIVLTVALSLAYFTGCTLRMYMLEPHFAPLIDNNVKNKQTVESFIETDISIPVKMPSLVLNPSKTRTYTKYSKQVTMKNGQHLLLDIKYVDTTFLESEQKLAQAMVDIVNLSKLTLLSYHCHSLLSSGVNCVGVLLESYISFHTWPKEGVIILDFFTFGSELLISLMPIIERYFAIPRPNAGQYVPKEPKDDQYQPRELDFIAMPRVVWKHTFRGFCPSLASNDFRSLETDIGKLSNDFGIIYKKEVRSRRVQIFLLNV